MDYTRFKSLTRLFLSGMLDLMCAILSMVYCIAGVMSMYTTNGQTGIGWVILGLLLAW